MNDRRFARVAALLATFSTIAMVAEPMAASAQSAPNSYGYGQNGYDQGSAPASQDSWGDPPAPGSDNQYAQSAPPPAQYADPRDGQYGQPPPGQYGSPPPPQYAPPPQSPGWQGGNAGDYQPSYGEAQARYYQSLAQNCTSQHNSNTAAGLIFGGAAGALLGFSLAGWAARGAWALFGGTMGATLGAALGSSANSGSCQNGYAYAGPAYGPVGYAPPAYPVGPSYGPAPSGGWMWTGERWVHRPYRYGYRPWRYRPAGYPNYRY